MNLSVGTKRIRATSSRTSDVTHWCEIIIASATPSRRFHKNFLASLCFRFCQQSPPVLKELLDSSLSWDFDIFRLEDLTRKRPLQHLGMSLFINFEVSQALNCDEKTLFNWLTVIEANYRLENSYHNSTHAADVMQVRFRAFSSYTSNNTINQKQALKLVKENVLK